jgi:hypothetical protein
MKPQPGRLPVMVASVLTIVTLAASMVDLTKSAYRLNISRSKASLAGPRQFDAGIDCHPDTQP